MNKQELMVKKEELEIKLDVYSRSDREAYERVLNELLKIETKIKKTLPE